MKNIFSSLVILFCIATFPAFAQKNIKLTSPDGHIVFTLKVTAKAPVYQVVYKGKTLIQQSELGLIFKDEPDFGKNLRIIDSQYEEVDEVYELVVGKVKSARDKHNGVVINLAERGDRNRRVNLSVRVFDDGLAFRYEFPTQENWSSYVLTDENSTFNIVGNPIVRTLMWDHYNNTHEGFYHRLPLNEIPIDTLMDMPALFEFPDNVYMAITEANLRNYAGMYLTRHNGVIKSQLSPLQGQTEEKVRAQLPHHTPWRVMMINDRIGALLESNILTSLNDAPQTGDWSWLKPGKTSFHWWNGDIIPDTIFPPGVNFETNKYYIDFCARNTIEYHSVIGYGGFAWYKSDAAGYGVVGPNTDVTQTVPSLNMQQVCDYAKTKGVDIHVWVHWRAIYPDLERAFSQFQKWGVKGMMVDFLERDDQEMVNIQEEILKKAAEHKLFIQFHGSYKPTGLHRTYPNEFTREGTHNYEFNKWSERPVSPDHDLDIVFTRLLAGAADYHLGGFRAVPETEFKTQYTRPLMIGTRCHMMAMYVIMESYLNMVADYPAAYEGESGFEFLQQVPTTWDETIVPGAAVDQFATIARRKGTDWYVGTINSTEARQIQLSFDFLPPGTYSAEIYEDTVDADRYPNKLLKRVKTITSDDVITINLAAGGGHVVHLTKI